MCHLNKTLCVLRLLSHISVCDLLKRTGILITCPDSEDDKYSWGKNGFVLQVPVCCKLYLLFNYVSLVCNGVSFAGLDVPAV